MGEAFGRHTYHATYCGPIEHLKGAAAHVKRSGVTGWVLAKFESATLNKGATWHPMPFDHVLPAPAPVEQPPPDPWGYA